jgi:hypothetical protein
MIVTADSPWLLSSDGARPELYNLGSCGSFAGRFCWMLYVKLRALDLVRPLVVFQGVAQREMKRLRHV